MKRGQVTLFVVIGLAVLLIVGLVLMVPGDRKPSSLVATQESAAVSAAVQQCLAQVGEESIIRVGEQGGYADLGLLKDLPTQDTQVVSMPLQKIPLWHEVHSCTQNSNGCLGDNHPTLCARGENCPIREAQDAGVSFQGSIQTLVERNIASCLNDFAAMPNVVVRPAGEPKAHAVIRDEDVSLVLDYPLELTTSDNQQVDLEEFTATVDINLPQSYELARKIQLAQQENQFLESIFLDMIEIYSGITGPLPPFRDTQFKGAPHTWLRSDVQRTLEQDVLPFLSFIQIINAQEGYVPLQSPQDDPAYTPYAEGVYEHMTIQLDDTTYPLAARVEYTGAPIHLDINGKEYLKPRRMPDTGVFKLLGLDIRDYRFRYTAAFPVVVRIHDPAAFNGRGFTLNFGLEGNVRNNHPLNTSQGMVELSLAAESIDLSEEGQLVDHTYTVIVTDNLDGKPLDDALVTYACGGEFSVGITDASGSWTGRLPYCISGGHIIITKEGYLRVSTEQSNTEDDGGVTEIEIGTWRLQEKTILLFKRTVTDVNNMSQGGSSTQYRTPLMPEDSAVVQVAKEKESVYEEDVPVVGAIKFGGSTTGDVIANSIPQMRQTLDDLLARGEITAEEHEQLQQDLGNFEIEDDGEPGVVVQAQRIELVPGKYNIEGTLIYSGLVEIPAKRKCERSLGGLKKTCYTLEAQNFTSWVSGGAIIRDGGFELAPEDVYNDKNIVLFVLEMSFYHKQKYWCKADACVGGCTVQELRTPSICMAEWRVERTCELNATSTAVNDTCMASLKAQLPKELETGVYSPYPLDWDDIMQYQDIERYQTYARAAAIRPEIE
jgi:hypothetical protein